MLLVFSPREQGAELKKILTSLTCLAIQVAVKNKFAEPANLFLDKIIEQFKIIFKIHY